MVVAHEWVSDSGVVADAAAVGELNNRGHVGFESTYGGENSCSNQSGKTNSRHDLGWTMSDWPIASYYSNMLQNPQIAFRDPELKTCVVESNPKTQQPKPRTGAFAAVYKGSIPGKGDVAIRVFTRASGQDHRERYAAISDYLNSLNGSRPASLVDFNFHEKGIRVANCGGKWFPLLTMEWVPGSPMFDWVRSQCHDQNSRALGDVSEKWIQLIDELCGVEIAHGDLQHGNVMVTPSNELKLVDYDCMCVPKLVGLPNLEIGVEPYQHQERDENTKLYPGLDNFSALYILVVLRALAAEPRLWFSYNETDKYGTSEKELYDKLLFRKEDFDSPNSSKLLQDLKRSSDEKVRRWAKELADLWDGPLLDVPSLQKFVCDFDKVRELLGQHAFDEALAMVNRNHAPLELQSALDNAEQRVQRREELEQAVNAGNEAEMARLYDPNLLDNYPRAKEAVEQARQAPKVIQILQELTQARQIGDGRKLVEIWDGHQSLLSNRSSARSFQSDVNQWRERNSLANTILREANNSPCDVASLRSNWERLKHLGGHPEVDRQAAAIQQIIARHESLAAFLKLPGTVTLNSDQAVVSAWNESLFAGWNAAEKHRPRFQAAEDRVQKFQAIQNVIRQHNGDHLTRVGEEAIVRIGADLNDGYHPPSQSRIDDASRRLRVVRALEGICQQPAPSEIAVAVAWRDVREAGADPLVDPGTKARAKEAMALAPLLQKLNRIPLDGPPDPARDKALLTIWDDRLVNCAEAQPWQKAWEDARGRRKLLHMFEQAIAKEDVLVIGKCASSSLLAHWPFTAEQKRQIAQAKKASQGMNALVSVLRSGDRQQFAKQFNTRVFARFPEAFRKYQNVLRDWIPTEIAPRQVNGLALPTLKRNCIRKLPGLSPAWELKWNWPEPRYTDACLLKLCRSAPSSDTQPESISAIYERKITRKNYEVTGGGRLPLRPFNTRQDWKGLYVVVWACFDILNESFTSEPLILGRLP